MDIDNTEKGIGFFERVLALVDKYKIKHFIKAAFVILLIAGIVGFIKNPMWAFEKFDEWKEKQHQEQMDLRNKNNEKIQHLLDKSLYKIGCDRITLLECHNGQTGSGGLPFSKCSATFEVMDNGIWPIGSQYQDQQLSLMPFATYLFKTGYFSGDIKELEQYDRGLYHRMVSNGTEHFAACVIEGIDKPLAFLFVSYTKPIDETHNCEEVRENIRHLVLELAVLLEIRNYDF